MKTFGILETTITEAEVKNQAENFVDPSSITITITDPDGTKVVDGITMHTTGVGEYYYDYTIPSGAVKSHGGKNYLVVVTVTDETNGTRITIGTGAFRVR